MEEILTIDMRITAGVVKKIADEHANNPEILVICRYVLNELRKTLRTRPDSIRGGIKLEAEEVYGLNRAKVILNLMRTVNQYGDNDQEKEEKFAFVQTLVQEKLELLRGGIKK